MPGLGLQDVLGQLDHFTGQLHRRNVLEIGLGVSYLVAIPQGRRHQSLVERLQHHNPFPTGDDDLAQPDHAFPPHRFTDHGKRILPNLILGGQVIRAVQVTLINFGTGKLARQI